VFINTILKKVTIICIVYLRSILFDLKEHFIRFKIQVCNALLTQVIAGHTIMVLYLKQVHNVLLFHYNYIPAYLNFV
jgi:hypothetical protein